MPDQRRAFLKLLGVGAAGLALPLLGLASRKASAASQWGALVPDPNGILDLPRGFSYRILERLGDPMDDGFRVPGRPDGMACFELEDGRLALMRNHELSPGSWSIGPYDEDEEPAEVYTAGSLGGVTRLVLDPTDFSRVSSNLVLTGTNRNCAGGPSPWGWLSCEENLSLEHGYVFLCDPEAQAVEPPQIKKMYGRFNHEAASVHPQTRICYLTEDSGSGCFYRFKPDDPREPFVGKLQAMRVVGQSEYHTTAMPVGSEFAIDWVDLDNPDAGAALQMEARSKGAAVVVRGEGLWIDGDDIWFCATSGGPAGRGQIFRLRDGTAGPGMNSTLTLVVASDDPEVLDMPDNICVAPTGELFMAEDGGGDQYIRYLDLDGVVCDFARNAKSFSELAGVCFSPDGRALFVNMQVDGLTLVVTGPFAGVDEGDGGSSSGSDDGDAGDEGEASTDGGRGRPNAEAGLQGVTVSCACELASDKLDTQLTLALTAAALGLRCRATKTSGALVACQRGGDQ